MEAIPTSPLQIVNDLHYNHGHEVESQSFFQHIEGRRTISSWDVQRHSVCLKILSWNSMPRSFVIADAYKICFISIIMVTLFRLKHIIEPIL